MSFDPPKSEKNIKEASRGFGFEISEGFDWNTAVTLEDKRFDYGEPRFVSYGFIGKRLHAMVWTPRKPNTRIISLRKANARERTLYAEETR